MAEEGRKSVMEVLEESARQVKSSGIKKKKFLMEKHLRLQMLSENMNEDDTSEPGLIRFKLALNKVVENVKMAYEKEQNTKMDLFQSVKEVIRGHRSAEKDADVDSDSNEDNEEAQSMEKVPITNHSMCLHSTSSKLKWTWYFE